MRNIILDCDPGIDDAIAIGMAAANKDKLRLLGIITVAGNQDIEILTRNALKLTNLLSYDVPVAKGCDAPLIQALVTESGEEIHGKDGLGNVSIPETDKKAEKEYGVEFLCKQIRHLPEMEKVTLVPTGPLTNIALLLKTFPDVLEKIESICMMGGAMYGGNVTEYAEYNIWADPEAAQIVFGSGLPIIMCGLDVTLKSGLNSKQLGQLEESGKQPAECFSKMLQFFWNSEEQRGLEMVAIHDATTILYLLYPEIFETKRCFVDAVCGNGVLRGKTICSDEKRNGREGNVLVLTGVNKERYGEILMESLLRL